MIRVVIFSCLFTCTQLGQLPDDRELRKIQRSSNYDTASATFFNQDRGVIQRWRAKKGRWSTFTRWFLKPEGVVPERKLPEDKPVLEKFTAADGKLKTIWLGHSTILLNIAGKIIMFDPVFSAAASPFPFMVKRYQSPVLKLQSLPAIDFIVISHDHYDHLDKDTIEYFKDKRTKFFVPLGVGAHLRYWGIKREHITELDWWDERTVGDLHFVATPAQHWSGRIPWRKNRTLWASWVIVGGEQRVYFSGDTGYNAHLKEIGAAWGPFDVAYIDSGQYNEMWAGAHLLPKYFAQAFHDLRAKLYFPIHWAMFNISVHSWQEPAEKLYREAAAGNIKLTVPKLGEMITIGAEYETQTWWR